jgi:GNAT superfamily N-acetyltransferase
MKLEPENSRQAVLIEKNFRNAFIASAHIQKQHNKSQYVFSKIPHPIFNCVLEAIASEHDVEKTIHYIWEDYQKNNTPHCWWITQRSEPRNFSAHLEHLGFQKGPIYRGMHLNLQKTNIPSQSSPYIRIKQVTRLEDFDDWIKPLEECFELSKEVAVAFAECYKNLHEKNNQFINYTAFYENKLAGVATLFLDKDSVGLYSGAVVPKFRKKGIITHLLNTLLIEARNQGNEDVVTHVNEGTHNITLKAGFREYLQLQSYLSP